MKQIVLVVMLPVIGMTSASMLWEKDTMDVLKTIARKLDGGFPGDEEKFPKAISKKIYENSVEKPKKPQCNLDYLACVKKHGATRKAHLKCGKKFIKCKKVCYKKCKVTYKGCMKKLKDEKKCKAVWKKCAGKCPHLSKCAKKCKATLFKCKKNKRKHCLKEFLTCVKACRPKGSSYAHGWSSKSNE